MIRSLTLAALVAALLTPKAQAQGTATQGTATQGIGAQGTATQGSATQGIGAQGTATQGTAGRAAVNDSLFAMAAADGGLTEVTLSELGIQKATDPELKRFSQQMVDEHTRMNAELATLASRKGVTLPRTVDVRSQFCAQSLAGLSGQEFDRCYAKAQLVVHLDSVATFEAEAERGMDPDMKALASKSLSHIKQHLAQIKPIAQRYEQEKPSTAGARSDR